MNTNDRKSFKLFKDDGYSQSLLDAAPLCCIFFDDECNVIDCNKEAVNMFELSSKQEFKDKFYELIPEYQPDGRNSNEKIKEKITLAIETGYTRFEWMHNKLNSELVPTSMTLVRIKYNDFFIIAGYVKDLREIKAASAMLSKLESLAFTDGLTEIYNRRYFDETATKEYDALKYKSGMFGIIMIDIDKFKNVNDTYGHSIGDEVLKQLAQRIKKFMRSSDLFARYGGEEFVVLVLDLDKDMLMRLAWRIRNAVANTRFECRGISFNITVSLGVSVKQNNDDLLADIITRADTALYKAKAGGRNTVEYV